MDQFQSILDIATLLSENERKDCVDQVVTVLKHCLPAV